MTSQRGVTQVDTKKAACPECGHPVSLKGTVKFGRTVICPGCDAQPKAIEPDPLRLDWVTEEYEDEEDW
jgi:lysine biosynthesis protein LysW